MQQTHESLLQKACQAGKLQKVEQILKDQKALIEKQRPNYLLRLFDNSSAKYNDFLLSQDVNGDTAIHIAAIHGHESIVSVLHNDGVPIDAVNKFNYTPLHQAAKAEKENTNLVEYLLNNGASPNALGEYNRTPLHCAVFRNHLEIVRLLLDPKYKVDINARADSNQTPLHIAAFKGYAKILDLLIKHKADINLTDDMHYTALHTAVFAGHVDCVKILLDNFLALTSDDLDAAFNLIAKLIQIAIMRFDKQHHAILDLLSAHDCTKVIFRRLYSHHKTLAPQPPPREDIDTSSSSGQSKDKPKPPARTFFSDSSGKPAAAISSNKNAKPEPPSRNSRPSLVKKQDINTYSLNNKPENSSAEHYEASSHASPILNQVAPSAGDNSSHLQAIQQGIKLKAVPKSKDDSKPTRTAENDMFASLRTVIEKREQVWNTLCEEHELPEDDNWLDNDSSNTQKKANSP